VAAGYEKVDRNMDDRLSRMFRAIDVLCQKHGTKESEDIETILGPDLVKKIRTITKRMGKQLRSLIAEAPDEKGRETIEKIAQYASGAHRIRPGFGGYFLRLLEKHTLPDGRILEAYYESNPRLHGPSWSKTVKKYRDTIEHEVWLNWDKDQDIQELFALTYHLHDLLIRIVLKMLNYTGEYVPSIFEQRHLAMPLDWVNEETTASDLGYTIRLDTSR
jgi:hypothetical protein